MDLEPESNRILPSLVRQYYAYLLSTFPLLLVMTGLVVALFYSRYRETWILAWGVLILIGPSIRFRIARRLAKTDLDEPEAQRLERMTMRLSVFIATTVAAGTSFLFHDGENLYNVVVGLWTLTLFSATIFQSVPLKRVLLINGVILGGSLSLRVAAEGGVEYLIAAGIVALYCVGHVSIGLRAHGKEVLGLRRQHLNEALTAQLAAQARAAELAARQAEIAKEEAMRSNREKSRFLAAATHDLRQPLHAMALTADALRRALADSPQQEQVDRLVEAVTALDRSLNAMLDLSKLDAGAMRAKEEVVSIAEIFRTLHLTFFERALQKGLSLRFRHANAFVVGDRQLLTELLSNVIDNAVKYTPQGSILVAARHATLPGAPVLLQVRDSGIGIPGEFREEVFEEFFQVSNEGRVRSAGLGLGLSIVRRLAELMKMKLELSSAPGCGTKVTVICERSDVQTGIAPSVPEEPLLLGQVALEAALSGRRILIVDNELEIIDAAKSLFTPYGATVEGVSSADQAETLVDRSEPFDIAFVDYHLGGAIDGQKLARRLLEKTARLRAILVTGDTSPEQFHRMADSPMPVLYKPVRGEVLLQCAVDALATEHPLAP